MSESPIDQDLFGGSPKPVRPSELHSDTTWSILKRMVGSLPGSPTSKYGGGSSACPQDVQNENAVPPMPVLTYNQVRTGLRLAEATSGMGIPIDLSTNNRQPLQGSWKLPPIGDPSGDEKMKKSVPDECAASCAQLITHGRFFPMEQPREMTYTWCSRLASIHSDLLHFRNLDRDIMRPYLPLNRYDACERSIQQPPPNMRVHPSLSQQVRCYDEHAPVSRQVPPAMNGSYPYPYQAVNPSACEAISTQPPPNRRPYDPSQYHEAVRAPLVVRPPPVQLLNNGQQPVEVRDEAVTEDRTNHTQLDLEYPSLESESTKSMRQEFREMLEPLSKILDRIRLYQKDWDLYKLFMNGLRSAEFHAMHTLHDGLICKLNLLYYKIPGSAFLKIIVPTTHVIQVLQDIHQTYHDYSISRIHDLIEDLFDRPRDFPMREIDIILKNCTECVKGEGKTSAEADPAEAEHEVLWNGETPDPYSSEEDETRLKQAVSRELDLMFEPWRKRLRETSRKREGGDRKRRTSNLSTKRVGESKLDSSRTSDICPLIKTLSKEREIPNPHGRLLREMSANEPEGKNKVRKFKRVKRENKGRQRRPKEK